MPWLINCEKPAAENVASSSTEPPLNFNSGRDIAE
jgi:hypothetical protein